MAPVIDSFPFRRLFCMLTNYLRRSYLTYIGHNIDCPALIWYCRYVYDCLESDQHTSPEWWTQQPAYSDLPPWRYERPIISSLFLFLNFIPRSFLLPLDIHCQLGKHQTWFEFQAFADLAIADQWRILSAVSAVCLSTSFFFYWKYITGLVKLFLLSTFLWVSCWVLFLLVVL